MKRLILLTSLLVTIALAGSAIYIWREISGAWAEVERQTIRLEAGMRHESVLNLKSRIADLDAALSLYERSGFGSRKQVRVAHARRAILNLEAAIAGQGNQAIPVEEWSNYRVDLIPASGMSTFCSVGRLYANGSLLAGAHVDQAFKLLSAARGEAAEDPFVPLNMERTTAACADQYKAEVKKQTDQYKSGIEKARGARPSRARTQVGGKESMGSRSLPAGRVQGAWHLQD